LTVSKHLGGKRAHREYPNCGGNPPAEEADDDEETTVYSRPFEMSVTESPLEESVLENKTPSVIVTVLLDVSVFVYVCGSLMRALLAVGMGITFAPSKASMNLPVARESTGKATGLGVIGVGIGISAHPSASP
jgi:hypothetical protein